MRWWYNTMTLYVHDRYWYTIRIVEYDDMYVHDRYWCTISIVVITLVVTNQSSVVEEPYPAWRLRGTPRSVGGCRLTFETKRLERDVLSSS